ncbi:U3 snoRNP protein [Conglomerata obtusa]
MQKEWKHRGEVTKEDRPLDSLLSTKILFDQSRPLIPVSTDIETVLKKIVKRRLREKKFDNFIEKNTDVFNEKQEDEEIIVEEDASDDEMTKEEMIELFWTIDGELGKMCDFGNISTIGVAKNVKKIFEEKIVKKKKGRKDAQIIKELKKNKNVKFV